MLAQATAFMDKFSLDLVVLLVVLLFGAYLKLRARNPKNTPPGPAPLPVLGNLFDIPTEKGWVKYASMGYKYGTSCALSDAVLILTSDDDQAI